jgi:hypothetical protein
MGNGQNSYETDPEVRKPLLVHCIPLLRRLPQLHPPRRRSFLPVISCLTRGGEHINDGCAPRPLSNFSRPLRVSDDLTSQYRRYRLMTNLALFCDGMRKTDREFSLVYVSPCLRPPIQNSYLTLQFLPHDGDTTAHTLSSANQFLHSSTVSISPPPNPALFSACLLAKGYRQGHGLL